ncbi:hypothetical protein CCACVL1_01091, partial [Corchorus capsularis]
SKEEPAPTFEVEAHSGAGQLTAIKLNLFIANSNAARSNR